MSSIVIAGDTSGSVTLQAPAVSGSTVLTLPSTTGTVMAPTSSGTAGQVLTSSGSATPTWVTPSAGALTLLSTVTASSSATVDVESTFSSTYDSYLIIGSGVTSATDAVQLNVTMKLGGSYAASSYSYYTNGGESNSATNVPSASGSATSIPFLTDQGNASDKNANFAVRIFNPSSTTLRKMMLFEAVGTTSVGRQQNRVGGGSNEAITALTGIRFAFSSGNIAAGKFRLYGLANS